MSRFSNHWITGCGMLALVVLVAGCGGKPDPTLDLADYNKTNILRLRNAYEMYMYTHNNTGPESEDELKDYLKNDPAAKVRLGRMGVETAAVDDMFVSERDGKPFKVRYGLTGLFDHAIVFEEEGVEGKREVALAQPRAMDTAEYDGYFTGKIKPEGPDTDTDISGEDEAAEAGGPPQTN